jgi:hypothetical protein
MNTALWIMTVSVIVGCIAAFLLLLLYKLGIVEWLQVHGDPIISKLAQCDYCMSFWLCGIIMLTMAAITDDAGLICVPIIATPIARRLL